jgi:hypothetical protein
MSLAIITLLPVLVGFGLLYWGSLLSDDDWFLRLAFQLLFIPLCWLSINLGVINAKIVYASDIELVTAISSMAEYLGYLFLVVGVYYFFRTLGMVHDIIMQKKADKEDEMHG